MPVKDVQYSLFSNAISSGKQIGEIKFVDWLQAIKDGKWREEVATIRGEKDPQRQSTLKKTTLQGCSPSGVFWEHRRMVDTRRQWAIICIDIDKDKQTLDLQEVALMVQDEKDTTKRPILPNHMVVLAYHQTARYGWAVYYKYDPPKQVVDEASHKDAFEILKTRWEDRGVKVDQGCKDPTRLRYVSHDPHAWWCDLTSQQVAYTDHAPAQDQSKPTPAAPQVDAEAQQVSDPPSEKAEAPRAQRPAPSTPDHKRGESYEHWQTCNDVAFIVAHCERHGVDLLSQYAEAKGINLYDAWLKMGQALADIGTEGEQYFDRLSQLNPTDYDSTAVQKKWQDLVRKTRSVKINTFFYMAQIVGVPIRNPHQQQAYKHGVNWMPSVGQAGGAKSKEDVVRSIVKIAKDEGATGQELEQVEQLAQHIAERPDKWRKGEDKTSASIQDIADWFGGHDLRYNQVSQRYEWEGRVLDDRLFSTLYLKAKKHFDASFKKGVSRELAMTIIESEQTPAYNPFLAYLERIEGTHGEGGHIDALIDCLSFVDAEKAEFCRRLVRKWLVGIAAAMMGDHSVLCLVFSGAQGIGKTRFFRELLPDSLSSYYCEDKLKEGKDSMILLSRKLIICDDEWGGKSKKDVEAMKEILSKTFVTHRVPYGQFEQDMKRTAVFCGTTNRVDLLSDDSGNRRVLPVEISGVDFAGMAAINRDALFSELLQVYQADPQGWHLGGDVVQLKEMTDGTFDVPSREVDILRQMFHSAKVVDQEVKLEPLFPDMEGNLYEVSATWICKQIEWRSGGRYTASATRVGSWLKGQGFTKRNAKRTSIEFGTTKKSSAWVVAFTQEFADLLQAQRDAATRLVAGDQHASF